MSSNPSTGRRREKLSRAEIKAYEARKAAEQRRIATKASETVTPSSANKHIEHSYVLTSDDEFSVIKSDLVRLGVIVVVLLVLLAASAIVLG